MNQLPTSERRRGRRPSFGRPRRPAMTAGSILAEMPRQVRRMHHLGGPATTREEQRESGPAAVRKVAMMPSRRGHVRQNAMVWDDLVSVLRVEIMRAERGGKPVVGTLDGRSVCVEGRLRGGCDRKTQSLQGIDRPSCRLSDGGVPGDVVPCKSPPRVERMAYCFDANDAAESGHGRLRTAIGRMARRLSPPVVARMARRLTPPSLARRPPRFGSGGNGSEEASHGHSTRTLDTYISDDSEDDDDTSSLEYSDDDSDVERAILASAAAFGGLSMNDNVVHDDFWCAICLERGESASRAKVSGCSHQFCFRCIDQWAEARRSSEDGAECPLCKKGFHWALSSRRMRWY